MSWDEGVTQTAKTEVNTASSAIATHTKRQNTAMMIGRTSLPMPVTAHATPKNFAMSGATHADSAHHLLWDASLETPRARYEAAHQQVSLSKKQRLWNQ